jgi:hypothetical protein
LSTTLAYINRIREQREEEILSIERERQLTTSKGEERESKERLKEKAIELIDSRLSLSIQFIHSFHKFIHHLQDC